MAKTVIMDKQNKNQPPAPTDPRRNADQAVPLGTAAREATKDISNDPDLSIHSPNDDLDEGELARLGENNNPIE